MADRIGKQVPEQTISDECKYCAEGEPEWSPYAKCWIHRRPTLDKRCTRKVLGPCGELRKHLYDSEDSTVYFLEGLVMDQRENVHNAQTFAEEIRTKAEDLSGAKKMSRICAKCQTPITVSQPSIRGSFGVKHFNAYQCRDAKADSSQEHIKPDSVLSTNVETAPKPEMLAKQDQFMVLRMRTIHEAERWLYLKGYHFQGEFDIAFPDGRRADLRGIVADFADFYDAYMQDRMRKMEQLYREAVDCLPPRTIVIERPTNK